MTMDDRHVAEPRWLVSTDQAVQYHRVSSTFSSTFSGAFSGAFSGKPGRFRLYRDADPVYSPLS